VVDSRREVEEMWQCHREFRRGSFRGTQFASAPWRQFDLVRASMKVDKGDLVGHVLEAEDIVVALAMEGRLRVDGGVFFWARRWSKRCDGSAEFGREPSGSKFQRTCIIGSRGEDRRYSGGLGDGGKTESRRR
jgi:hypothetical protein